MKILQIINIYRIYLCQKKSWKSGSVKMAKMNGTDCCLKVISLYVFMQSTVRTLLFSVNFSLQILNRLQSSTTDLQSKAVFTCLH